MQLYVLEDFGYEGVLGYIYDVVGGGGVSCAGGCYVCDGDGGLLGGGEEAGDELVSEEAAAAEDEDGSGDVGGIYGGSVAAEVLVLDVFFLEVCAMVPHC